MERVIPNKWSWLARVATAVVALGLCVAARAQVVETLRAFPFEPYGIAVDRTNNLYYVADSVGNRIMRFSPATNGISTLASGAFLSPQGIVLARGGLVVSDSGNHRIRFVSLGGSVSTIAGGTAGNLDGVGAAAQFRVPAGLAVDAAGNLYVADSKNNAVRKIAPNNTVTTLAGNFYEPSAVAVAPNGEVFVADTRNHSLKVIRTNGVVDLVAGADGQPGFADGAGLLNTPRGLTWIGGQTGLLVADTGNNALRSLTFNSETRSYSLDTLVGFSRTAGFDDGVIELATFNGPVGVALDADNMLAVCDLFNNAVRRVRRVLAQTPVMDPSGGAYSNAVTVVLTNLTPGSLFYYTTNGADPNLSSITTTRTVLLESGPVVPLRARAVSADFGTSLIASNLFTFFVNPPQFSVSGGTYSNDLALAISSVTSNSVIRYTLDGSVPQETSPAWRFQMLSATSPVLARGFRPGYAPSAVVSNTFTFVVAPLVVTPAGVVTNNTVQVSITTKTTGTQIYWTIDGSEPSSSNPAAAAYNGAFRLGTNGTLKARGFKTGYTPTETVALDFKLKVSAPEISPAGASTNNAPQIILTTDTIGADIYWTINNTEPSPSNGTKYNGAFSLTQKGVFRAKAFKAGFEDSQIQNATFNLVVSDPVITPTGADTNKPITISLRSATRDADFYWSNNGIDPGPTNGSKYGGPFELARNGDFRVKAFRNGFDESGVASGIFHFTVATPVIDPPSISTNDSVLVTLSTVTPNADLYWTINGSDPSSTNGFKYTNAFVLAQNGVLKVKGFRDGFDASLLATGTMSLNVSAPVMTPPGITTNDSVQVTLESATPSADIYWTINGSDPSPTNGFRYAGVFTLSQNGIMRTRAFRAGFVASPLVTNAFNLSVTTPVITPAGITTNDSVLVRIESATPSADIYWTINGSEPSPTNGNKYLAPFTLAQDGTLRTRGFRTGFVPSGLASNVFNLKVSTPVVTPAGIVSNNAVAITITSDTPSAQIYYTIDGSTPTTGSSLYNGIFSLQVGSTLRSRGFRTGFVPSDVTSNVFRLVVDKPIITTAGPRSPSVDAWLNAMTVSFSSVTDTALFKYTTDGSDPVTNAAAITVNGGTPVPVRTNSVIVVVGIRNGFENSPAASQKIDIQVPAPLISPSSGFFPQGTNVTATVARADGVIRYRLDGTTPTEADAAYAGPIRFDSLTADQRDLRFLAVRAFATNTLPSDVVRGTAFATNSLGVPLDTIAGIGSTVVVPIVANLASNQPLRSLQFRVEIAPVSPLVPNLQNQLNWIETKQGDFVKLVTSEGTGASTWLVNNVDITNGLGVITNTMIIAAIGTNANVNVKDFGVVSLLSVPIPSNAREGDRYSVQVTFASGTTNGLQGTVNLQTLPARSIIVSNLAYTVGDTAQGRWYNAGDFGDGKIDNADVNNAFSASLGVRVPFVFTDAFDAMDVFPLDSAVGAGGDGRIRFLDWQYILQRSLGLDTRNWKRVWSTGGVRGAIPTSLPSRASGPVDSFDGKVRGSVVVPEAAVLPVAVDAAHPGNPVSVPLNLVVKSGSSVGGLQFRAVVKAEGRAPVVTAAAEFKVAEGLPAPVAPDGLPANEVAAAWSLFLNKLAKPLDGKTLLGTVTFTVPQNAQPGDLYTVDVVSADGAPNEFTQYDIQGGTAVVAVQGVAPRADKTVPGFRLNWQGFAGSVYVVESSSDLVNGPWTVEADNIPGRGRAMEYVDRNTSGTAKFYRVRPKR